MKALKTKGIKPKQLEVEVENMRKRRPCIGLCHLNRVAKAKGLPGFLWKHPKQVAKERQEEESKGSFGSWNCYIRLQELTLVIIFFFRRTSSS